MSSLFFAMLYFFLCRNAHFERVGAKPPKALKTGTTIVGVIFKVC